MGHQVLSLTFIATGWLPQPQAWFPTQEARSQSERGETPTFFSRQSPLFSRRKIFWKEPTRQNPCPPEHWSSMRHKAATILEPTGICPPKLKTLPSAQHWGFDDEKQEKHKQGWAAHRPTTSAHLHWWTSTVSHRHEDTIHNSQTGTLFVTAGLVANALSLYSQWLPLAMQMLPRVTSSVFM